MSMSRSGVVKPPLLSLDIRVEESSALTLICGSMVQARVTLSPVSDESREDFVIPLIVEVF